MKILLENIKIVKKDSTFALAVDSVGNLTLHEEKNDLFGNKYYEPFVCDSIRLSSLRVRVYTPNEEVAKKEIEKYLLPTGKFDTLKSISCVREIRYITGLSLKDSKHVFEEVVSSYLKEGEEPFSCFHKQ